MKKCIQNTPYINKNVCFQFLYDEHTTTEKYLLKLLNMAIGTFHVTKKIYRSKKYETEIIFNTLE